ncbi:3-phosphoserine/phosphohydroxythreonine transaminase [Sphingobacterium sp. SYP-B4668]|uniref:3-phosphoserine/phosphohydroxythreonine transaminase n=1 Tax=Sphingobacterium sp. SYP-B4668 TaxID=2996035 RepID=UPI0022DD44A4|nr:3-phosphoserine/phosphohydroxythreonine transaminase [Sphingobacterium sp. SYP-B4668]
MNNKHNFNPGPAILPASVLEAAADAARDYMGKGLSLLEISHRTPEFEAILVEAEELLRELMGISSDYAVLFLSGGASQQFAQVPLNLLPIGGQAAYLDTGVWASKAIDEARVYGDIHVVASGKEYGYRRIPTGFSIPNACSYFHYTSNNTIYGTETIGVPNAPIPLVCDMSSDILSQEVDVSKYALIYASAQKNMGPAGVSVVIVKKDVLGRSNRDIPNIFDYSILTKNGSLYNTPPVYAIYVTMLNLRWLKEQGGIAGIAAYNLAKSTLLYREIDQSNLFEGRADESCRSRMNATFVLKAPEHTQDFLAFAEARGIVGIAGHRSAGGFRASLYNALPLESVSALVVAMQEYERLRG